MYVPDAFVRGDWRNRQAVSRLWRLNNRFVALQAVFYMELHLAVCRTLQKEFWHG